MHVFDQPARKATLGDITERDELAPAVAFNNAAAHGAAGFFVDQGTRCRMGKAEGCRPADTLFDFRTLSLGN